MNICFIEEKKHLGGKYSYYKNLLSATSTSCIDVFSINIGFYSRLKKIGFKVLSKAGICNYSIRILKINSDSFCKQVFLTNKKYRPDLIHIQHPIDAYYLSQSVWSDIPIVQTVHSFWLNEVSIESVSYDYHIRIQEIQDFSYSYISHFVSLNNLQYEQLIKAGVDQKKITIIPNTVDKFLINEGASLAPFSFKGNYLSIVCRLSPEKGVDVAIRALSLISEEFRPTLIIVGDGPQRQYLIDLAKALKISKSVKFLGVMDHNSALGVMKGSILNLCPSITYNGIQDTAPLSVLESIALGIPVAASRIGGLPDYIVSEKNGYLFNENDEQALSNIICKHIKSVNDSNISDMKSFMQEHSHEFSSKSWIEKYIDLYQRVINDKGGNCENS